MTLLGLRLTIDHVVTLGWQTVMALLVAVGLTIVLGLLLARVFKLDSSLGLLIGGATAICGASAALAISSVLPKNANLERDTTLTVVGAGYSLSPEAGDAATITKLMRVAFLMPVLVVISLVVRARMAGAAGAGSATKTPLLPWFTVVFVALMLLNSTGWVSSVIQSGASNVSQAFLVLAIAAVGLKTSLQDVTQLDWRPVAVIFLVTLGLAVVSGGYLMAIH